MYIEHEVVLQDFAISHLDEVNPPQVPLAVTKLLDRKEMVSDPKAMQAVRDEGRALVDAGNWREDTVREKDELVADAQSKGEKIHVGELMSICSIKFWERDPEFHKAKGRICFRGDIVKDEFGAAAVFQELSFNPTSIHTANSNLAYGCLPGHKTTAADAIRAYIQSLLKSKHRTWVHVPRELWPPEWHKKGYKKPMCLLVKALYGHPESGGHWEKHLTEAVLAAGGVPITGHPSSFWLSSERMRPRTAR